MSSIISENIKDILYENLIDRLHIWSLGKETLELYKIMYKHYLDNDLYDYKNFDIKTIVDNDWINWIDLYHKNDLPKADYNIIIDKIKEAKTDKHIYIKHTPEFEYFGKDIIVECYKDDYFLIRYT